MSWNPQPAIGGANWFGNPSLTTNTQLFSTTSGLQTGIVSTGVSLTNTSNFLQTEINSIVAGGGAVLWANYPAVRSVDMSGNDVNYARKVSTMDLQVSSINGTDFSINDNTGNITIGGITINNNTVTASNVNAKTTNTSNSVITRTANAIGAVGSAVSQVNQAVGGVLSNSFGVLQQAYWGVAVAGQVVDLANGVVQLATGAQALADSRELNLISGPAGPPGQNVSVYETFNHTTQLQFSTLGSPIFTVFRTTDQPYPNSTIGREVFISTIIPAGTKVVRSVSDPLHMPIISTQLLSTTNFIQSFGQWSAILADDYNLRVSTVNADYIRASSISTFNFSTGAASISSINGLAISAFLNSGNVVFDAVSTNQLSTGAALISSINGQPISVFINSGDVSFTSISTNQISSGVSYINNGVFNGISTNQISTGSALISSINGVNSAYFLNPTTLPSLSTTKISTAIVNVSSISTSYIYGYNGFFNFLTVSTLNASTVNVLNIVDNFVSTTTGEFDILTTSTLIAAQITTNTIQSDSITGLERLSLSATTGDSFSVIVPTKNLSSYISSISLQQTGFFAFETNAAPSPPGSLVNINSIYPVWVYPSLGPTFGTTNPLQQLVYIQPLYAGTPSSGFVSFFAIDSAGFKVVFLQQGDGLILAADPFIVQPGMYVKISYTYTPGYYQPCTYTVIYLYTPIPGSATSTLTTAKVNLVTDLYETVLDTSNTYQNSGATTSGLGNLALNVSTISFGSNTSRNNIVPFEFNAGVAMAKGLTFTTPSTITDITKATSLNGLNGPQLAGYNNNILNYEFDTTVVTEPVITYPFPPGGQTEFFWPQVGTWGSVINTFAAGGNTFITVYLGIDTLAPPPASGFTDIKNTNQSLYIKVYYTGGSITIPLGSTYRFSWTYSPLVFSVNTSPSPATATTYTNFNVSQNFAGVAISTSDILSVDATTILLNAPYTQANKLYSEAGYFSTLQTEFISTGLMQIGNISTGKLVTTGNITGGGTFSNAGNITTAGNIAGVNGTFTGALTAGNFATTNITATNLYSQYTNASTIITNGVYSGGANTSNIVSLATNLYFNRNTSTFGTNTGSAIAPSGYIQQNSLQFYAYPGLADVGINAGYPGGQGFYCKANGTTAGGTGFLPTAPAFPVCWFSSIITIYNTAIGDYLYFDWNGGTGECYFQTMGTTSLNYQTIGGGPGTSYVAPTTVPAYYKLSWNVLSNAVLTLVSAPYTPTFYSQTTGFGVNPNSNLNMLSKSLAFNNKYPIIFFQNVTGTLNPTNGGIVAAAQTTSVLSYNGSNFPVNQWSCYLSFYNINLAQNNLAINNFNVAAYNSGGNWAAYCYTGTATITGTNQQNISWNVQCMLVPKEFALEQSFNKYGDEFPPDDQLPPSTLTSTITEFARLPMPELHLSSITASTITMEVTENMSLLAGIPIPSYFSTGSITIAGTNNVTVAANITAIGGYTDVDIEAIAGNINVSADAADINLNANSNVNITASNGNVNLTASNLIYTGASPLWGSNVGNSLGLYRPLRFYYEPPTAAGQSAEINIEAHPADAGVHFSLRYGVDLAAGYGYLLCEWPGYIVVPMKIYGQDIALEGGETVHINANSGNVTLHATGSVLVDAPSLDLNGNNITNVPTIGNSSNLTLNSGTGGMTFYIGSGQYASFSGNIDMNAYTIYQTGLQTNSIDLLLQANYGYDITLNSSSNINISASNNVYINTTLDMQNHDVYGVRTVNNGTSQIALDPAGDMVITPPSGYSILQNGPVKSVLSATAITQPVIQYGTTTGSGNSGSATVTIPVAYASATSYVAFASMEDSTEAKMAVNRDTASQITIVWSQGGSGTHTLAWNTMGT